MSETDDKPPLLSLWEALNAHSVCMCGRWIPEDYDGEDVPPYPGDDAVIAASTEYLKAST